MIFFLFFSVITVSILSICLLKNVINHRFIKIAHLYNLFFFGLFLFLLFHQTKFILDDNRKIAASYVDEQILDFEIPSEMKLNSHKIKEVVHVDAPIIKQLPELPRGCEVTSLAMLLGDAGIDINKMKLAKEVKKDPTPYQIKEDGIYFGNPNHGFVGDMYNINNQGYGVYHKPIIELAEKYLPDKIVNLTGKDFQDLQLYLSNDLPVWVIINTTYKELPQQYFQTWETPSGPVEISYKEHAVLITGYNKDFIFFNDPLSGTKNKKASKADFIKAWVQMGSQAITYVSE